MSLTTARQHLARFGAAERVVEHPTSSATVELAAQAVGTTPQRIAKTLAFTLPDGPIVIVVAGDARIDNRAYKARFGVKASMISPSQVEQATGHGVGGVCPFGLAEGVRVYLDTSLRRFQTVFPAAGSPNSSIEVTIKELETFSEYGQWVSVCAVPDSGADQRGDV
ncbi:MAG: YbaK/EbsC family protein [Propionibacteriaceae bacterium]|jgi:prolyl-tRNA editing enzyme YbaK/EbsC (Cys-tRNA(Pro) deacylase)|nr:YbaK/EbsC family protein [Propionibacteriaceae bacterium]